MRDGKDATLICTGGILQTAVLATQLLAKDGIYIRLLSMHTLKPLDTEAVLSAARDTGAIVTLEEHSIVGGLGSAVAEILAEAIIPRIPFKRIGVPAAFSPYIGSQEFMRERHGLTPQAIAKSVEEILQAVPSAAA